MGGDTWWETYQWNAKQGKVKDTWGEGEGELKRRRGRGMQEERVKRGGEEKKGG